MIKKLIFTTLFSFILLLKVMASHGEGGQITYRYLSNNKFEVIYKHYRNCKGIPSSNLGYTIRCASTGATKSLNGVRISIADINNTCPSKGIICNPQNQTISGTESGLEEHTYIDTLDFNGSESAFKSCCIIQIGIGGYRPYTNVSTSTGYDYWVFSTLDLCKAPTNSSPVFTYKPTYAEGINERIMRSYFAKDTIDNDSLSYSFTDPMTSWAGKASWAGGYDSKNPFTAYYPTGYNKALGPKPEAYPPIGIYLDAQTGNLIAMPTNASEATMIVISVKEWRKDSNGKYVQIGEIVIDHSLVIYQSAANHTPAIGVKMDYNICEGQTFTLDIPTDDQPVTVPPPGKAILNDTVTLTWDKNIKNASYTIPSPNVKLPVGKFEWTPATGDSKKLPFSFTVIASDNACPRMAISKKTIKLHVYPKINVSSSVKKINSTTYAVGLSISNKSYSYVAGKNITSVNQADIRNYYFKSSKSPYSTAENDTIVFKRNGTYIISQSFLSVTECNNTNAIDTIKITNLMEVTLGINSLGTYTDTSFCQNELTRLDAKVTNAKRPVTYNWKTKTKTLSDTLGYFSTTFQADDTVFLTVKDAAGQSNSTFRFVKVLEIPEISAGADKTVCPGITLTSKAKQSTTGALFWEWFKDGTKISSIDSITLSVPGVYIVSGTNANGCRVYDTMNFRNFTLIKVDLISGEYCQDKKELVQNEFFTTDPNLQFEYISWSLVRTLQNTTGGSNFIGDIVADTDPTSKYDYKIMFDDTRILIPSGIKDSIILRANATDTNGCKSLDNMTVTIIKKPVITFGSSYVDVCINKTLDLALSGTSAGTHQWVPFYRTGFGNWPSYQPIAGDTLTGGFFKTPDTYKIRLDATVQFCTNNDSFLINVLPLPRPKVSVSIVNEAVRFKDITPNVISRKWFINNSLFSVSDTLLASKSFINTQPVKLEITNTNGCTGDTIMYLKTGFAKSIYKSEIKVYPNPANTQLVLIQLETWIPSRYEIYDVLGKIILSGITRNKEELINLQTIKPGVYYLKYYLGKDVISIPFIRSE